MDRCPYCDEEKDDIKARGLTPERKPGQAPASRRYVVTLCGSCWSRVGSDEKLRAWVKQ